VGNLSSLTDALSAQERQQRLEEQSDEAAVS
jgi:hypothetical protein